MKSETRMNVLLIEDNPGDVRLAMEAFTESNMNTNLIVAGDGCEAIALLTDSNSPRPDLIILDLNVPKINGREFLSDIKMNKLYKTIPVVVMSTSNAEKDINNSYELNANCYITKPHNLLQYFDVIRMIELFWFRIAVLPK